MTLHDTEVDKTKVESFQSCSPAKTVTQVRSLLGIDEFYRHIVKYYVTIVAELNDRSDGAATVAEAAVPKPLPRGTRRIDGFFQKVT